MCKGLFKVKSERKIKGVDVISYFKQQSILAKGIAVCFAIFTRKRKKYSEGGVDMPKDWWERSQSGNCNWPA